SGLFEQRCLLLRQLPPRRSCRHRHHRLQWHLPRSSSSPVAQHRFRHRHQYRRLHQIRVLRRHDPQSHAGPHGHFSDLDQPRKLHPNDQRQQLRSRRPSPPRHFCSPHNIRLPHTAHRHRHGRRRRHLFRNCPESRSR